MSPSRCIIFAPYWRLPGYVGDYRVDRYIRWLADRGDEVVLVRGGDGDDVVSTSWGVEVTIKDPLGVIRSDALSRTRRPNLVRRSVANFLFNPDAIIAWGRRAIAHPEVLRFAEEARWILSTSPPESPHLAASLLARRVGAAHIVDMRDGWLDEPLKEQLQTSKLRRWREGRLESAVLRRASCIFVTSDGWREMLQVRMPAVREKIAVLTNAYPQAKLLTERPPMNGSLTLLYTGRLRGSRQSQQAAYILEPLLAGLKLCNERGVVRFVGELSSEDKHDLAQFEKGFAECGWRIEAHPPVSRTELYAMIAVADGLLLLSASRLPIPSKVFDYILARRPILSMCPSGSSTWRIVEDLPQSFLVDLQEAIGARDTVRAFLKACCDRDISSLVPEQYSERYLKRVFYEYLWR